MDRLSKAIFLPVIFSAFTLICAAARADTVMTFDLSGTYQEFRNTGVGTLSGTMRVDTITGVIQGVDFHVSEILTTPTYISQGWSFDLVPEAGVVEVSQLWGYWFDGSAESFLDLFIAQSSLVGYSGGPICSLSNVCAGGIVTSAGGGHAARGFALQGDFTPEAATPEPSSVVLLGTALLGAAKAAKRKTLR